MSDKAAKICIGLMSGSSMDGLDIAVCEFNEQETQTLSYRLLACETIPLPSDLILKIKNLPEGSARDIALCDAILGKWMGKVVREFITKNNIQADFIGSHGHTIFHEPGLGYTTQIGHPAHIVAETGIQVVGDFRMSDIAYGGQGAPMIPIAEKLLWPEYTEFVNLGGIVNIAFHKETEVIAYDVCAGNQLLNYLAEFKGLAFDRDGCLSQSGEVIAEVLNQYLNLKYFKLKAPKSLANDWVSREVIPIFNPKKFSVEDLLVTAMEASAIELAKAMKEHSGLNRDSLMISGGGAHHPGWIARINVQMQKNGFSDVYIPEPEIVDFKEAILIALTGLLRLQGRPNFIKSVTGARVDVSGGAIYLPAAIQDLII